MCKYVFTLVMAVFVLFSSLAAFADQESERACLKGLQRCRVRITIRDDDKVGIDEDAVRSAVELPLRQLGITIPSANDESCWAILDVQVTSLVTRESESRKPFLYTIYVSCILRQLVSLKRDGNKTEFYASTYSKADQQVQDNFDVDKAMRMIPKIMEGFSNDYLAVNPKR